MKIGKDYIGIFVSAICHDGAGNFLMCKRGNKARDRHGEWEFAGGAVELGELLEETLRREIKEELGAEISDIKQINISEVADINNHWIGIFYVAKIERPDVCINEPSYDEIGWFTVDSLPSPVQERELELIKKVSTYL